MRMIAFYLSMSYLNHVKIAFLQNANTHQNCQRIARSLPALQWHHLLSAPALSAAGAAGCMLCGAFAPIVLKTPDLANCPLSDFSGPALGVVEGDGQAIMKIVQDDVVADSQHKAWRSDGAGDSEIEIDPDGTGLAERRKRREIV